MPTSARSGTSTRRRAPPSATGTATRCSPRRPATWTWRSPSCAPAASSPPAGAAAPHRPGPLRGHHGGIRARRLHPQSSMTWSKPWAGTAGSPSPRSRGSARTLDEPLTAFRTRPLDHVRFPYVYLDATYCKARVEPPDRLPGRGHRHRHHRGRRPRGPGRDGRRQRERGVLDRVPALPARARPVRGPAGHHRPALGAGRRDPQGHARRRLAALPGSFPAQRLRRDRPGRR